MATTDVPVDTDPPGRVVVNVVVELVTPPPLPPLPPLPPVGVVVGLLPLLPLEELEPYVFELPVEEALLDLELAVDEAELVLLLLLLLEVHPTG
jgi:hypothetical protein